MFASLRSIVFSINASYWFYPALFSLGGFALALALIDLDRSGATQWVEPLGIFQPARPDGASNMLTVLAGSMIGVASTVFSITIAAVAYASGTYGPRLLTNFMEDKGNQLSLATFIGTFVYAITVLRAVRGEDEMPFVMGDTGPPGFVPQLSLLISFGLMIVAVGVLVYFLHHIPSSIRINSVLEEIGQGLLHRVRHRFPEANGGSLPSPRAPDGADLPAEGAGYIRYIDAESLVTLARKHGVRIGLAVRTGDFLHQGKQIAKIDSGELSDELADGIRSAFALGGSRTPEQDLEFSIDELVEIALRALSPGVNDPFTAITAIHWLGAATAELGRRSLEPQFSEENYENLLVPLDDDFAHYLRRGFGAARGAIASHRLTALVGLDALQDAARTLDDASRREQLAHEAKLLVDQAELQLQGPDLNEVHAHYAALQQGRPFAAR